MLKQRIITAIILIPLILGVLFYLPPAAFCILTGMIALGGAWEWATLSGIDSRNGHLMYVAVMLFIFAGLLFIPVPLLLMGSFVWWVIAVLLVLLYPKASAFWGRGLYLRSLMGILTLSSCWVSINYLRNMDGGMYLLLYLFVLIWGADITAYFVGKKWGSTKLAPQLSPGKSWQGFAGAMVFTAIAAFAFLYTDNSPSNLWGWVIGWSYVTVLFSIMGDLFESMMKRHANMKDSGRLLPGHGGLLDRIDSLTAAAPVFALGIFLLWAFTA